MKRFNLFKGVEAITLIVAFCCTSATHAQVNFKNDIVPLLTKAGCNMGSCHAKAGGGQNGFQLSLLGFEPLEDFEAIARSSRGRRISVANPDDSLILKKASGGMPHGGGVRLEKSSTHYQLLRRWIAEGARLNENENQQLISITVQPTGAIVPIGKTQQLRAEAKYSNGAIRNVTDLALYESNAAAMAEVTKGGLVNVNDIPGKVAVMVRYQGKVAVCNIAVPLGAPISELPEPNNFVDEHVFANLKAIGVPPSAVCDDATFLRRVSLDIAGRLPSSQETKDFLKSTDSNKRNEAIERLLASPGYADFFANKWTSLLKNRRDDKSDITSNFAFHSWLRDSLLANVRYDQIVRELLGATGTVVDNPPVAWYKRVKEPKQQLEDVAQLFLGVRMQCAQCHHHPFERWSQNDYYSLAAFFTQVGRKPTGVRGEDLIFHKRGIATAVNVKTNESLRPAALGDSVGDIAADEDPRLKLADWMGSPGNPYFAKALVNRYWKHFFNRGLIEPEDDLRDTNPPTNPELLAALESHFIQSDFDLKELVRVITRSKAYQLSAMPNEHNAVDRQNFSRYYPRRLQAEVLLDSIDTLTGATTSFANLPPGTKAIALPDNSYNKSSAFLQVFGRPNGASVCECERLQSSSLAQSLHLINSAEIKSKLAMGNGRAATLAKDNQPLQAKVESLYVAAFSRPPTDDEMEISLAYLNEKILDEKGNPLPTARAMQQNFQDLIWALMNTKEFIFNH